MRCAGKGTEISNLSKPQYISWVKFMLNILQDWLIACKKYNLTRVVELSEINDMHDKLLQHEDSELHELAGKIKKINL